MKLYPYHDAAGGFYPELDTREVSTEVIGQYLSISRMTVWERAQRGVFGKSANEGAWLRRPVGAKGRAMWTFRPAVIWRAKAWGRYAQVGFNPLLIDGKVRVYHCNPEQTAKHEQQRQPSDLPPEIADLMRSLAGTALGLTSLVRHLTPAGSAPIAFPLTKEH